MADDGGCEFAGGPSPPPPPPAAPSPRAPPATLAAVLEQLPPAQARWARAAGFDAQPGRILLLPGMQSEGQREGQSEVQGECTALAGVLVGVDPDQPLWQLAGLPAALPPGTYALADADEAQRPHLLLGWALGALPSTRQARQSDAATAPSLALSLARDRKSTRLNSSHLVISYAVFC